MDQATVSLALGIAGIAGTVTGGVVAQLMERRALREMWMLENRKQEFRETLSALSAAYIAMVAAKVKPSEQASHERTQAAYEWARTTEDRLFIGNELRAHNIQKRWLTACQRYDKVSNDVELRKQFEELHNELLAMARA